MIYYAILGLVAVILFIVFAFQNTINVWVYFLAWRYQGSLALVLIIAFLLGISASLLISIPLLFRKRGNKEKES